MALRREKKPRGGSGPEDRFRATLEGRERPIEMQVEWLIEAYGRDSLDEESAAAIESALQSAGVLVTPALLEAGQAGSVHLRLDGMREPDAPGEEAAIPPPAAEGGGGIDRLERALHDGLGQVATGQEQLREEIAQIGARQAALERSLEELGARAEHAESSREELELRLASERELFERQLAEAGRRQPHAGEVPHAGEAEPAETPPAAQATATEEPVAPSQEQEAAPAPHEQAEEAGPWPAPWLGEADQDGVGKESDGGPLRRLRDRQRHGS